MSWHRRWPRPWLLWLLLRPLLQPQVWAGQLCPSGLFPWGGLCCNRCPPGWRAPEPCGEVDVQCRPCPSNETSSPEGTSEPCQPCCSCPLGHFLNSTNHCQPCKACPPGNEARIPCGKETDTVCQPCPPGTYSKESSVQEPCKACTHCNQSKVVVLACTRLFDTLCMDEELHTLIRDAEAKGADLNVSSTFPAPPQDSGVIIPIYCSLLAAVVVGLLAYVAFKCWRTCKQKQQLAKARAGELGVSEGEKLHSDSSICLDTTGLHELHGLGKGAKLEPCRWHLYGQLPRGQQEEVEQLLEVGSPAGWQVLAEQLGFETEAVAAMGLDPAPAHTLLNDWATQGGAGATLEVLEASLRAIGREDVARALLRPDEANSMV
ncbi:tumor necrosis factor receptor superfamily member 16-like [Gracilinanus agilis]|uniref:tumor necrosis factor receptor superfamily member 16-like n=1 Tax=Gracilinanus agilis TaxID=191870 RepID=UPI001CFC513C|nr:tumor necrosis factor receptor superfamily member 16-like [Gracilinanus agilis]